MKYNCLLRLIFSGSTNYRATNFIICWRLSLSFTGWLTSISISFAESSFAILYSIHDLQHNRRRGSMEAAKTKYKKHRVCACLIFFLWIIIHLPTTVWVIVHVQWTVQVRVKFFPRRRFHQYILKIPKYSHPQRALQFALTSAKRKKWSDLVHWKHLKFNMKPPPARYVDL